MLVKVFIKRHMKKDKAMDVFKILRKIRSKAIHQDGYISGETMIDPEEPSRVMVVSTWQSMQDWQRWEENQDRKKYNAEVEEMLEAPTQYEQYVYSKYYLKVSS